MMPGSTKKEREPSQIADDIFRIWSKLKGLAALFNLEDEDSAIELDIDEARGVSKLLTDIADDIYGAAELVMDLKAPLPRLNKERTENHERGIQT